MVYWLTKSPFMVWCDLFAPKEEKEEYSAFTRSLMERGTAFEQLYDKSFPSVSHIDFDDLEDGFKKTKELMKQGADIIVGMPLIDSAHGLQGIADVLVKKSTHKSVFGRFHYVVQEVKSGNELKDEYILQAAFYHLIIGRVQGYSPLYFYVVTMEKDGSPLAHKIEFERYERRIKDALVMIQQIDDEKFVPPPNVKECDEPWSGYCRKKAIEADDVSLVANAGNDKQIFLRPAGITTVAKLAKVQGPVPGIADTKLEQLRKCAIAFKDGKSSLIQEVKLPASETELFIDFEGADVDGVKREYLLGVLERCKDKESFHAFVAKTTKEEGKMIKDAFAFLAKHPDAPIYHYASYEKTAIKALADRYRLDAKPFLARMTDLLQVCKRCVAPSTSTFQLKDFGKALGADWREGMNAAQSMVLYAEFQKTKDAKLMQKIIDYNEDDVRATALVKDWLVNQKV
jgi:uncharacterized protein